MSDLPGEELLTLDWQDPAYRFRPSNQALTWRADWCVPVYPDGDDFAFLAQDFTEGTFGHPWEQTLCVFRARLASCQSGAGMAWRRSPQLNARICRD